MDKNIVSVDVNSIFRWANPTAKCHGWGSDPHKWVSGLTRDEIEYVEHGGILLIGGCPLSGGGNKTGTTIRYVIVRRDRNGRRRMYHRVPNMSILYGAME